MAATTPTTMLCGMATYPAAGVMATRPTTAPIQNPSTEGFLPFKTSKNIHARPAAAAAAFVVPNAFTARGLAPPAEPALKPNQPNHSDSVPSNTYGTSAAGISLRSVSQCLLCNTSAPASAAQPAQMCTPVRPAKSHAPILPRNPSRCHYQRARG